MTIPKKKTFNPKSQGGVALVAVLWVTVLLSVIAAGFVRTTRVETVLARNEIDLLKAESLADAGVHLAIAALSAYRGESSDWKIDGTPQQLNLFDGELDISIQDQGGLVDLNTGAAPLIREIFLSAKITESEAEALTGAVIDWRDADNLVTLNGAEDRDYLAAGISYGAKDAPFDTVDELLNVYGMTRDVFSRVEASFTVFSGRPGIDPVVAPREILLALQMFDEGNVDNFLALRDAVPDVRRTDLGQFLSGQSRDFFSPSTRTAFSIVSRAKTLGGGQFSRFAIVSFPRGQKTRYAIANWHRIWLQGAIVDANASFLNPQSAETAK